LRIGALEPEEKKLKRGSRRAEPATLRI
jgi:hypothetical protein